MSKEIPFIIYCIEEYKKAKNLNGFDVVTLFNKYLVFDYIQEFFEFLHTTGPKYIIQDIDIYIESRNQ